MPSAIHAAPELAVVARHRPGEGDAFERFGERSDASAFLKNVDGARRIGDRLLVRLVFVGLRIDHPQLPEAHGLDGSGGRAYVSWMAGLAQNKADVR